MPAPTAETLRVTELILPTAVAGAGQGTETKGVPEVNVNVLLAVTEDSQAA